MNRYLFPFFSGLVALVLSAPAAHAGEPRLLATYGAWNTYIVVDGDDKICYMASQTQDAKGDYKKRGDAYAMITHRPADHVRNEFSYLAGYTYKPGSEVTVDIDGQKFVLFTRDDSAWTSDGDTDEKLAKAIAAGRKMTVRGTSSRGTVTTDSVSLKGSGDARSRIDKECR